MNINKLWLLCILTRIILIIIIRKIIKIKKNKNIIITILLLIGLGFIYKGYFGSNNEIQITNVFWHETRYVHGVLYIMSAIYLQKNNLDMNSLLLLLDILFCASFHDDGHDPPDAMSLLHNSNISFHLFLIL